MAEHEHDGACAHDHDHEDAPAEVGAEGEFTRREALTTGAAMAAGAVALAAAMEPLRHLTPETTLEQWLQQHYRELGPEELEKALKRIGDEVEHRFGKRPHVTAPQPKDGVEFVYALNIGRCVGCRRCAYACEKENNISRAPDSQYIRVLKLRKGNIDLDESEHRYDPSTVPEEGFYYMPVQCHQCKDPPCTKVCPVQATWTEPDGITVIDYDWCIGCRYCMAACPYWARRFNYEEPEVPAEELNTEMSYLSNRPRPKGVVEKCTFCLHRTREGKYPACLEVCPTGARKFGNILDPESEVSKIVREKRVFVLKEEAGTLPRFFYFFDK